MARTATGGCACARAAEAAPPLAMRNADGPQRPVMMRSTSCFTVGTKPLE